MIRWKVINGHCRVSCCVTEEDYIIKYKKGETVKAKKGTLGVFTFDTEQRAITFLNKILFSKDYIVIKVKSVGRAKKPQRIGFANCLLNFYSSKKNNRYYPITAPEGTICYPAVKVLE